MYWDIIEVKTEKKLTLWVRFEDNTTGNVQFILNSQECGHHVSDFKPHSLSVFDFVN